MPKLRGIIALDLDGTLLNSEKRLSDVNRAALEAADKAGYAIVPTTGRFYGGMPEEIRRLPFVRWCITVNGAAVTDVARGETLYRAEIACADALRIMEYLDTLPGIYDCYMANAGFMAGAMKQLIDETVEDLHYRRMLHELRQSVPDLKRFIAEHGGGVQKIQFFTRDLKLRERLLGELEGLFPGTAVSSSQAQNVEINERHANKGEALLRLAERLGVPRADTFAFGDGLNDLSMIKAAGVGIAMANASEAVKAAADRVTLSCDEDGIAYGIENFCVI